MKRIWILAAFVAASLASAQTQTTYTGTIKDLTGTTVTSGRIAFTLNAPSGGNIPGTGAFVSTTVSCLINASGAPVSSSDGVSPCVIENNTSLTPTGTSYTLCIQPYFVTPGSCYTTFATGGTVNISTLVPTPATQPNYGVASTTAQQEWSASQTFDSATALTLSTGITNGIYNAGACNNSPAPSWCSGSDMGAWINAAIAALPTSGGEIFVPYPASGGTWNISTPISDTTKTIRIRGAGTVATDNTGQHSSVTLNWTGSGVPITVSGTAASGTRIENLLLNNHGTCTTGIDLENSMDVELSHVGFIDPAVPCTTYGIAVGMTGNMVHTKMDDVVVRNAAPIGIQTGQLSAKASWRRVRSMYNSTANLVLGTATLDTRDFGCDDCTFEQNQNADAVQFVRASGAMFNRVYTETGGTGNSFHVPASAVLAQAITIIPGYTNLAIGSSSTCYFKNELAYAGINIVGGEIVGLANPGYIFCNSAPLSVAGYANIIGVHDSNDVGVAITDNWAYVSAPGGSRCNSSGFCNPSVPALAIGANTVLPSTLTGVHGNGVKLQLSDGTGTSGNLSKFDANGNATNGPLIHGNGSAVQASDGTGTNGNLVKYDANGNASDGGIAANRPPIVTNCGTTTTCSNSAWTSPRIVWGVVTLSGGTATVTGISPAFSTLISFSCTATDYTAAAAVKISLASTSSITITGTGTDQVTYVCVGN